MNSKPQVVSRPEQPYVAIRAQVSMQEIPTVLPPLVPEVYDWLKTQGAEPAGAPFFRYLGMDARKQMLVEVGVPVGSTLPGDGRVQAGAFPSGRYAVLTHTGPYDRLSSAWKAFEQWKASNGMQEAAWEDEDGTRWGTRTEFYLTAPGEKPDPETWQTELALMIREAGDDVPGGRDSSGSDLPAGLSRPAQRALAGAGYVRLEQFTRATEADVLKLHGMGPKAMDTLRRALAEKGLSFAEGPRDA